MYRRKDKRCDFLAKKNAFYCKELSKELSKPVELWDKSRIEFIFDSLDLLQDKMTILLRKLRFRNSVIAKKEKHMFEI